MPEKFKHVKKIAAGLAKKLAGKALSVFRSLSFSFEVSWKSSKGLFILRILLEVLSALQPLAVVYAGKKIVDLLAVSMIEKNIDSHIQRLTYFLAAILIITLGGMVIRKVNEISTGIHKDIIGNHIDVQIMKKTTSLDISFFDSPVFHNELLNARTDSLALQTLAWVTINIVNSAVQFITAAVVLASLHWIFPAVLVLLSIPSVISEKKFTAYAYNWMRHQAPEQRKMSYIQCVLTDKGFSKDIRLFGVCGSLLDRYIHLWKEWFSGKKHITIRRGGWAALLSILPQLGVVFITFQVSVGIFYGRLTIGDYSLFTGVAAQVVGAVFSLLNAFTQVYDNDMRISKYKEFLSWKPGVVPCGVLKPSCRPRIEFENVSFRYPGTVEYVLKDLCFTILPGEKFALVGLNGSGKTTIVKLLLRFYDPDGGRILADGKDIREYDIDSYRKLFSAFFQDYTNYAFSLRENIAISDLKRIDQEQDIMEACLMSGVGKLVEEWEKGLDTYLTRQFEDGGRELSGGQWQKVAIARAFFREADFIVLDEPSAALDPEAEYEIFKHFSELCKGRGAVFISHRLSNVTMADKILVLEGGRIIESGPHNELLKKGGRYAYLFNLQAEKYR